MSKKEYVMTAQVHKKRAIKDIQRPPLAPLPAIDNALEELGHQRRALSAYRKHLRSIELQLYRISGYHRHKQRRPRRAA